MKKFYVLLLMMVSSIGVYAQDDETTVKYGVDTLVISKVVRWSNSVSSGSLEQSYQSIENPYGAGKSSGAEGSSIIPGSGGSAVKSDTLVMSRVDDNSVQSIVADTVYFRGSIDPFSNQFSDSLFVTRFTHTLHTGEASGDANYLTVNLKMSGTLKIYARSLNATAADRTIKVTQNGRVILESVVADSQVATDQVDLAFFTGTGIEAFLGGDSGHYNYYLDHPQTDGDKTQVDVYPVLSVRAAEGDVTIEFPVGTVKIYGIEIVKCIGEEDVKPALLVYPGRDGILRNGVETDFLSTAYSNDPVPAIGFGAAYSETDNNIELFVPGQFKKGDVFRIAGVYSSENEKNCKLNVFTVENGNLVVVATTNPLINAMTSKTAPVEEVFTLTRDYDRLFIGRSDKTTGTVAYLTSLRVEGERTAEEMEAYEALKAEFEAVATAREDLIPLQERADALEIPEDVAACNYASVKNAVAIAEAAITDAKNAVQNVSDIIDAGDISTTNKEALENAFATARQKLDDATQAIADAIQAYDDAMNAKPVPGDITGTGEVTSDDFDLFAQMLIEGTLPQEGDEDFERYDANGDGYVDISDLQAIMNLSLDLNADGSTK